MITVKTSESFESSKFMVFQTDVQYKTTKYSTHWFSLPRRGKHAKDSGIMEAKLDRVGNKELVVGDDSVVRIDFGMKVKDLEWNYYVVTDYTEEDFAIEHPDTPLDFELKKLTPGNFTTFVQIKVFNGDTVVIYDGGAPGDLTHVNLPGELDAIEFHSTLAGSVHFDMFKWYEASPKE
ncbi:hypothetical protein ACK3BK_17400 [Pseudomonas sp. L7]|uniref:hypothetical protein n=1 Tax=Pseudomonas sp. L7 TaxID=3388343 RepID=UPI003984C450